MTITAASLAVEFGTEGAEQVQRTMQSVDRQVQETGERGKGMLQSWGSAATKFGGILSLSVTAPLVLAGKTMTSAASDLNEAGSAVDTVFGSAASTVQEFAKSAAGDLGVSREAALSAASGMGALFKGVGLGENTMAEFSTQLLTTSSDLGSFFNEDPTAVMDALRSGLVGQAEPLRRFGILLTEDAVKAKGLEMGLADANGELSEGAKVQARYALIMEQVGAATGDFARTSDGLANSQRILQAEIADLSAELGGVLLPYVQRGVGLARDLVGWISNLSPAAQRLAVAIGVAAAAAGPFLVILGQTMGVLSKLGPLLGAVTGPLGLIALAVAGLALAWKNNWFGIRDITAGVVDWLQGTFGRMIEFFQNARDRGLGPFRLAMRTLIVTLSERIGDDNPIVRALRGILRNGEKFATWWATDGSTTIKSIWGSLTGQDGRTPADAGWLIDHLFNDLQGGWDKTIGPWFDDRNADLEAFGKGMVARIRAGVVSGEWAALGSDLGSQLAKAATDAGAFAEPNWTQLGIDLVNNTKREIDFLSNVDQWTAEALGVGGFETSRQSMIEHGRAIGQNLWTNTQDELRQLQLAATWATTELQASDWGAAAIAYGNQGRALIAGFMHGAQDWWNNQFAPWITGLPGQIIGIFANAGEWLKAAGGNMVAGLQSGFNDKWTGFTNNVGSLVGQTPGVANEAVDAESPAKKLMPVGANMVDGILAGAAARFPELYKQFGQMTARTAEDGSRVPASFYGGGSGGSSRAPTRFGGDRTGEPDPDWRSFLQSLNRPARDEIREARTHYGHITPERRESYMRSGADLLEGANVYRRDGSGGSQQHNTFHIPVAVNGVQDPKAIAEDVATQVGQAIARQLAGMGIA